MVLENYKKKIKLHSDLGHYDLCICSSVLILRSTGTDFDQTHLKESFNSLSYVVCVLGHYGLDSDLPNEQLN